MPVEDLEFRRLSGGVLGDFSGDVEEEVERLARDSRDQYRCLVHVEDGGGNVDVRSLVECW